MINRFSNEKQDIKRLLRRRGSREFFKGDGWTENPDEARDYSDVLEAAETCVRYGLNDVELALRMGTQASDFFCTRIR
ncbi:MAG TPA: hypothetical protein VEC99_04455 [Clostridia bacterium]|nr:hypothetical protein [Clostridia bacterium]